MQTQCASIRTGLPDANKAPASRPGIIIQCGNGHPLTINTPGLHSTEGLLCSLCVATSYQTLHIQCIACSHLCVVGSALPANDLTLMAVPALIPLCPLHSPDPGRPHSPLLGLSDGGLLRPAGPIAPRPLLLLCGCAGLLSSALAAREGLPAPRDDRVRISWVAGSDPDFVPSACNLRSIAMVLAQGNDERPSSSNDRRLSCSLLSKLCSTTHTTLFARAPSGTQIELRTATCSCNNSGHNQRGAAAGKARKPRSHTELAQSLNSASIPPFVQC